MGFNSGLKGLSSISLYQVTYICNGCEGIKNFLFVSTLYYFKQEVTRYQEKPLLPSYNQTNEMH